MSAAFNYPIYDADNHLYEPPEAFLRHLPKQFKRDFRYVEIEGRTKLLVDGILSEYIPNPTFEVVAAPGSHESYYRAKNPEGKSLREITGTPLKPVPDAFFHPKDRLKIMDEQGVHAVTIFPTLASVVEERLKHKPESIAALFHSLNQWLLDEWGFSYQDRMFPVPFVNLADVDAAVAETGASSIRDMGRVMGALKGKYTGQMDFGAVGGMVKDRLSNI